MGIRGAIDYKMIKNKQKEECYVEHIGIGIANIVSRISKKGRKNDKYINIDPECYRMIHIPQENMDLVQFEFLSESNTEAEIRVILRSSDDEKYGYNKDNPKIIYQYKPKNTFYSFQNNRKRSMNDTFNFDNNDNPHKRQRVMNDTLIFNHQQSVQKQEKLLSLISMERQGSCQFNRKRSLNDAINKQNNKINNVLLLLSSLFLSSSSSSSHMKQFSELCERIINSTTENATIKSELNLNTEQDIVKFVECYQKYLPTTVSNN